jgi:hypothetical protein
VVPINSSVLTLTLYSSVTTTLIFTTQDISPFHDVTTELQLYLSSEVTYVCPKTFRISKFVKIHTVFVCCSSDKWEPAFQRSLLPPSLR